MKRILIPTDFSPCANDATEVGLAIASKIGAEVFLLHLHHETVDVRHVPAGAFRHPVHDTELATASQQLTDWIQEASHRGVRSTPVLVHDTGIEKIEKYIESYHIDLVVMGSHGAKGIREWVIGSKTQHLVRHADVPVLVIKSKPDDVVFKNIVFASTFEEEVKDALRFVASLAKYWQAQIHMLYINMNNRAVADDVAREKMKAAAAHFPNTVFTINISETNDAEWAVHQFCREINADMVVIPSRDKTGAVTLFASRISERLVNHEEIPVLVVN